MSVNKRIIVVTTENPFPPKNGVTIPVYNYIKILSKKFIIDICILDEQNTQIDHNMINKQIKLGALKQNTLLDEILLKKALFEYNLMGVKLDVLSKSIIYDYDYVLCSPISAVKIGDDIKDFCINNFSSDTKLISAISDCYTAVLSKKNEWNTFKDSLLTIISKTRSVWMRFVERKVLQSSDFVFVQSQTDKDWLVNTCNINNNIDVRIITNGVDDALFTIETNHEYFVEHRFLFVATFTSSYYKNKLHWFYLNVWKKLSCRKIKLVIRGQGLSSTDPKFKELFNDPTVEYYPEFAKNIQDIYSGNQYLIAPIFKSYGFINKVGEAMASSLIVIGDVTAFNAIDGIISKKNCLIANNAVQFIEAIELIVNDKELRELISSNARALAIKELKWNTKNIFNFI